MLGHLNYKQIQQTLMTQEMQLFIIDKIVGQETLHCLVNI